MDLGLSDLNQSVMKLFSSRPCSVIQIRNLILLIFVFFNLKTNAYSAYSDTKIEALRQQHQEHRKRWLALHQTESVKNLDEAYRRIYDRHDTAACFYLSKFYMNLNDLEQFNFPDPNQKLRIADMADKAKMFCIGDQITRREAMSSIRDAIRLIGEREPLSIQRSLATTPDNK